MKLSFGFISYGEKRNKIGIWEVVGAEGCLPFSDYKFSGFFADANNKSDVMPIDYDRGLPDDVSDRIRRIFNDWEEPIFVSWLTVDELLDFDYEKPYQSSNSACKVDDISYRTFFGDAYPSYIDTLKKLKAKEIERIVFWFWY